MKKKKRIIPLAVIILLVAGCMAYVTDSYRATSRAMECLTDSDTVTITDISEGLEFDGPGKDALVFYPGAKVEYLAYVPLMKALAEEGIDCYLVRMPLNLAIFGKDKAGSIISDHPHDKWYIGGHSLGGVMAAVFASDHDLDGLVLLAAYPTKEIDEPTLEIYGTKDGVLNLKKVEDADKYLPENNEILVIEGGNHAYFGDYGEQKGDGEASITRDQQQLETVQMIKEFFAE